MRAFTLFAVVAAMIQDGTLKQDLALVALGEPKACPGVMCGFLAAFQEDLGKISKALEVQVTLLQESGSVHKGLRAHQPALPDTLPDPKDPKLAVMVGMLGSMYDTMKERIGKANKAEKKAKADFDVKIADLEGKKKLAESKGQKIDDTYDRIEKYWKKQRALSHKQYHNLLKLTHSGMSRFEKLLHMGKDAQAGKPLDKKEMQEVKVGMPTVVLLQTNYAMQTEIPSLIQWIHQTEHALKALMA